LNQDLRLGRNISSDKAQTAPCEKVGVAIGRPNDRTMLAANQALAVFLGFA
jgi:hypothetical protein